MARKEPTQPPVSPGEKSTGIPRPHPLMPVLRDERTQDTNDVTAFLEALKSRNLPIDPDDARRFAEHVNESYPSPGFLSRLARTLYFIDEETFNADVAQLRTEVTRVLPEEAYALYVEDVHGSNPWIFSKLLTSANPDGQGISASTHKFTHPYAGEHSESYTIIGDGKIGDHIPVGMPVFLPDDLAITMQQILSLLYDIDTNRNPAVVALLYASVSAIGNIESYPNLTSIILHTLPASGEHLTADDYDFIEHLSYDIPRSERGEQIDYAHPETSFTWLWYKVPDNIPAALVKGPNRLIREERFQPPYKSRE